MPKWNSRNDFDQMVAKRVFALQKQFHAFPNRTMESARRIRQYSYTQADVQVCQQASGIKNTGAGTINKGLKTGSSIAGQVGTYANLISTISQGGAVGAGGAVGLINTAAADIEGLFKNKAFQRGFRNLYVNMATANQRGGLVNSMVGSTMGPMTEAQAAAAGQAGLNATRFMGAAAATARAAGAYVALAYAGVQAFRSGLDVGDKIGALVTHQQNVERNRISQQTYDLIQADASQGPLRQKLAGMIHTSERNRLSGYGALFGEQLSSVFDAVHGSGARKVGALQTRLDAYEGHSAMSGNALRSLATERFYEQKSGKLFGGMEQWFNRQDAVIPNRANEAAITAKASEMQSKANSYSGEFYRLSSQRRFKAAREFAKQANDEIPGTIPGGMTPEAWYKIHRSVQLAEKSWVISNSQRVGSRDWD